MGITSYRSWHDRIQRLAPVFTPRVRLGVVILLMILPAGLMFFYIRAYGVNVVYWDRWGLIPVLGKFYARDPSLIADCWRQHGEHRFFFGYLAELVLAVVTHWNIVAEMLMRWLFTCLICYVLLRAYMRTFGSTARALAGFIPVVWIVFWLRWYPLVIAEADQTWGMESAFFLLALYLLATSKTLRGRFALAAVSGVVSSFSHSPGLLVWPIGLVQILWVCWSQKGELRRVYLKMASVWCLTGICVFVAYFTGYTNPGYQSGPVSFATFLYHHFSYSCRFFLAGIGGPLASEPSAAVGIGFVLLLLYIGIALYALTRRPRPQSCIPLFLSLILFALLVAALDTYERSEAWFQDYGPVAGINAALAARYTVFTGRGVVGLYLLLLSPLLELRYKAVKAFSVGLMLSLVVVGFSVPCNSAMQFGQKTRDSMNKAAYYLSTYKLQSPENLAKVFPVPLVVFREASILEEHHLNVFSRPGLDPEKLALADGSTLSAVDIINSHLRPAGQSAPIIVNAQSEETITISGWAVDLKAGQAAGGVFVSVDGRKDVPTIYGSDRHDVADVLSSSHYRYSGFWASFATSVLGKGQHTLSLKIVTSDKEGYYNGKQQITIEVR